MVRITTGKRYKFSTLTIANCDGDDDAISKVELQFTVKLVLIHLIEGDEKGLKLWQSFPSLMQ